MCESKRSNKKNFFCLGFHVNEGLRAHLHWEKKNPKGCTKRDLSVVCVVVGVSLVNTIASKRKKSEFDDVLDE